MPRATTSESTYVVFSKIGQRACDPLRVAKLDPRGGCVGRGETRRRDAKGVRREAGLDWHAMRRLERMRDLTCPSGRSSCRTKRRKAGLRGNRRGVHKGRREKVEERLVWRTRGPGRAPRHATRANRAHLRTERAKVWVWRCCVTRRDSPWSLLAERERKRKRKEKVVAMQDGRSRSHGPSPSLLASTGRGQRVPSAAASRASPPLDDPLSVRSARDEKISWS